MSGAVSGFDDEENIIWDPAFFYTLDGASFKKLGSDPRLFLPL